MLERDFLIAEPRYAELYRPTYADPPSCRCSRASSRLIQGTILPRPRMSNTNVTKFLPCSWGRSTEAVSHIPFDDGRHVTCKLSDLITPFFGGAPCIVIGYISCIGRVIANFEPKFPKFRCHGKKGQSGLNFNDTIKLPKLVNPQFGARCSVISLT